MLLDADETRHYNFPSNGTPSMIFVFSQERQLGAWAYDDADAPFAPGTSHANVRLDFWADDEWTDVVQPGAEFVIWYGGDIGRGTIEAVL